ncbi:PAS domain-containing protein [Methanoregula sp.]|uniref:PAS domain-containing protein n=1 Tax=Methanoregula sp. TaxID=2052170 RepID=UPI003C20780A
MIRHLSTENEEVLRLFIIAAACIGAILTTIFSLTHGIFEVFPFLYILPIILAVYFYPKRAVLFSLGISLMYISLIYLFGFTNPGLIAIATAWFAIFMTIGVVASSYANQLIEERSRIRTILENSQDGIFCFDLESEEILEINPKCALWLKYDRADLIGRNLGSVWSEPAEREQFVARVRSGQPEQETEGVFRSKDGTLLRLVISAVLVTRNRVLCSAIDITGSKIVDEEIRRTLEDLEEQVRARTAHLEKINEELQAEILERRRFEKTILARQEKDRRDAEDDE